MEWKRAIWLYPQLWMIQMSLREPLAAVLRLSRAAQNLSQEDFHGRVEPRQLSNIEHAKSSPTLSTLEDISAVLDINLVALLAAASSYARRQTPKEFLKDLAGELAKLQKLGVLDNLDGEFSDGKLHSVHPRIRSKEINRAAILKCKAEGRTQVETAGLLGLGQSTVSRLWKDDH